MKILVKTTLPKLIPLWIQRGLFGIAILTLGYCGFVAADTWIFQERESAALARFVPEGSAANSVTTAATIGSDGLIGRIDIPHLDLSVVVMEGIGGKTLRRAVGHIGGTALPGQVGNIGIAGHRDTFFRPLRNIQPDDLITLTTLQGQYRYRVVSTKVVSPDNVAVLNADGNEVLTLVTCYPFYFLGPAPSRFIVRAARVA